MIDYSKLTDEELCELSQKKDSVAVDFLINRYLKLVKSFVHHYYLTGGDLEDLVQVGQIAVFKAITTYQGKVEFKYYVFKCIKNAIISAIKKANTLKNMPLNSSYSLSGIVDGDEDKNPLIADLKFDPIEKIVNTEAERELKDNISLILSRYENLILSYYLQGFSYVEISEILNKTPKSIDNALQRIKKKISLKINIKG